MITKTSLMLSASVAVATLAFAVPAFAQTTTSAVSSKTPAGWSTKVACIGRAVIIRESALGSAMTTLTSVENGAYAARSTALSNSYALTTPSAVNAGVKAAWSTFTTTLKNAHSQWTTARTSAWSAFKTSAAACKAPAGLSDSTHSASDVSGS